MAKDACDVSYWASGQSCFLFQMSTQGFAADGLIKSVRNGMFSSCSWSLVLYRYV